MTSPYIISPDAIEAAESALDEIIIGLLGGDSTAHDRWLDDAPQLLRQAPEYNIAKMIGAAIKGAREFDALEAQA